jgi:hypothetical protein
MSDQREDKRTRRGACVLSACAFLLLLVGLVRPGVAGGPTRQSVFRRAGESRFSTQGVSSINFESDVHADLAIRCWERPQLQVEWSAEAFPGEGVQRSAPGEEPEKTFGKEINVVAEKESDVISVRARADTSRFSAVTSAAQPPDSKETLLKDRVSGLLWRLKLTVFVPYGANLDTRQFKGATFVACGGSRGGVTPAID